MCVRAHVAHRLCMGCVGGADQPGGMWEQRQDKRKRQGNALGSTRNAMSHGLNAERYTTAVQLAVGTVTTRDPGGWRGGRTPASVPDAAPTNLYYGRTTVIS
jgi:hypothetical protein